MTTRAQTRLKEALDSQSSPKAAVRVVAIRGPHGCVHGWDLAISQKEDPGDTAVQEGSIRLVMGAEVAEILRGATVDYREDGLGIGFVIEAPNAPRPMHGQEGCACDT
ncbi:MAG: iron-sulfur cluster assembly accessory protein [Chloroflexi bacterium]|nr:iron-sulfur cluster assembly accessory protein [Chloroflexota bacterium]